jgi:probable phosphoglycerate mutase
MNEVTKKIDEHLVANFDGGAWPNPGGIPKFGWTVCKPDGTLISSGKGRSDKFVVGSNNEAEYFGLIAVLEHLTQRQWKGRLTIKADSKLVVEQVKGAWQCNKPHLIPLRDRCRTLIDQVATECELVHVGREFNAKCDQLVKDA